MGEIMNSYERLAPYYEAAQEESAAHQSMVPIEDLRVPSALKRVFSDQGLVEAIASSSDVAVIAEHKRRSPSEGDIRPDSTVKWTVEQYQQGGAIALSVLTQNKHFGGFISDVSEAWTSSHLPVLRKDFIDNEYQLHEAKSYGAAAALLIVGGLSDPSLKRLYKEAEAIGLDCLVEVHDGSELDRALEINPSLVGINNRNLSTLEVDLQTTRDLRDRVPSDIPVVAESGYSVRNPDHIRELRELGVDAVLMGTALMREAEPAKALAAWLSTDQSQ